MARTALLTGLLLNCVVLAQEPTEFFYKKLNLIGGYSDNKGLIGKDGKHQTVNHSKIKFLWTLMQSKL